MRIPPATDAIRRLTRLAGLMGKTPEDGEGQEPAADERDYSSLGIGIALGVSIGSGLSIATGQYAFVGAGIAIGVALGFALEKKKSAGPENPPAGAPSGTDQS